MQIAKGNNLPRVKVSNQASIRRMIYYYGPITRSEIAERLHLTLPTITTNINSMIASGIVKELNGLDEAIKSMGRKAYPVDIIADSRYFLGVEMRGTLRSLTVTDYRGEIIYFDKDETPYSEYDVAIESTAP
jgi:predicted transcriptional regulator